jgi:drug/metabolite transporter (DMT)-like permease
VQKTISDKRLTGIAFLCTGALIFTLQDTVIKLMSGRYPLFEVVSIRCIVATLPLLVIVHFDGGLGRLWIRRPWPLLARGALLLLTYTGYYLGLAAIPLAEATSLFFSTPLFIVLLAGPVLGEKPRLGNWLAVIVGFMGVIIVCRPGASMIDPAAIFVIAAAGTYSLAQIMTRRLGIGERASVMSMVQNVVFLIAAAAMGGLAGRGQLADFHHASAQFLLRAWQMPDLRDFLLMCSTGLVSALGTWLLTSAYRIAEANVVAPFEYVAILWATIAGFAIFGEVPDIHTILGVIVIMATGVFVLWDSGRARR